MQVTYRLEDEDYRALAHFLLYQTPRGKTTLRRHVLSAFILSIAAAGVIYALRRDAVLGVLFGAFCFVLMYALRQRAARAHVGKIYRTIRPRDDRQTRDPGTLKLMPEYLEAQTRKGAGKVPWRAVSQVGRDAGHVFIILGQANAFAIPKREFENPEAFEAFYEQLSEYHLQAWRGTPATPPSSD